MVIENQRVKFYATSIEYIRIKDSEIALLKKAKMITEEEYMAKLDEFCKRIQVQFRNHSGNAEIIIRDGN